MQRGTDVIDDLLQLSFARISLGSGQNAPLNGAEADAQLVGDFRRPASIIVSAPRGQTLTNSIPLGALGDNITSLLDSDGLLAPSTVSGARVLRRRSSYPTTLVLATTTLSVAPGHDYRPTASDVDTSDDEAEAHAMPRAASQSRPSCMHPRFPNRPSNTFTLSSPRHHNHRASHRIASLARCRSDVAHVSRIVDAQSRRDQARKSRAMSIRGIALASEMASLRQPSSNLAPVSTSYLLMYNTTAAAFFPHKQKRHRAGQPMPSRAADLEFWSWFQDRITARRRRESIGLV